MSPLELQEFSAEIHDWLRTNLTGELREAAERATSVFTEKRHALAWQHKLNEKGWAAPHWPSEYGGPGWNDMQRHIFAEECAAAGAPNLSPMGLKMLAPVLFRFGSTVQKAHYLPRILSGEDYWCQGYSEPQAGSDLAALQLRAESEGGEYILNGSKIWTTHAHFATHIFCLVRTSREERPQEGISFLLIEMNAPGITVRPILTLAGDHDFNEVFFDNVRVPKANLLGDEGRGWTVAKALLEFERSASYAPELKAMLKKLHAFAGEQELLQDSSIRQKLSQYASEIAAIEAVETKVLSLISRGENPGPASSMLKVQGTECQQKLQELWLEIAGVYAAPRQLEERQPGSNLPFVGPGPALCAAASYFNGRAASIYGGSNEIQRNIMARLVLGV